ncbi:PREDICTED: glutamate-rich protein 2 isoform X4 [Thamnophis sirtalis]|uniref:Glutamate-rich protein 2 isoform X4 n=1 Tax=Thamnophis sirtalis TaxID=35019 RepID=A0A6I9Y9T7_9SAUR|nr:PREDICTED: glutamate-rich protein 2 isoform X4 [Thamnophis sirtalis]
MQGAATPEFTVLPRGQPSHTLNRLNVLVGQGIPRQGASKVSGMMEVIAPEDGFILETCLPLTRHNSLGRTDAMKEQKNKHNGRLHVFRPEDEKMKNSKIDEKTVNNEVCTEPQKDSVDKKNDEKPPDSSDDENNTGQTGNETQKRIAPLQLMGEFLKAIMERKFILAKKLCQMILIYEPSNPEAKQFLPLIEKKLLLESQSAGKEDEETEEESSDETEEETNSSEGSETETETSSEDSQDS